MALGVLKLGQRDRNCLGVFIKILLSVVIIANFFIIALSLYVFYGVAPKLYSERAEMDFVFISIGFFCLNYILTYFAGLKLCYKCLHQAEKKSTKNYAFFWSLLSFYDIITLIVIANSSRRINKHIIRSMKHSLQIGMAHYLFDKSWKITIDELQYNLQCCGINSFRDWHEHPWLTKFHVNTKSEYVKQIVDEDGNLAITPWSCCRISFPMQCLHDPLQQTQSANIWVDHPNLVVDSIYHKGCLQLLREPIQIVLIIFIILIAFQFIIQVILFLLFRLLYTSCRNAIILDDPTGIAPGWIFGRGDFGYNRGKTLAEIMYGYNQVALVEESPKSEPLLPSSERTD